MGSGEDRQVTAWAQGRRVRVIQPEWCRGEQTRLFLQASECAAACLAADRARGLRACVAWPGAPGGALSAHGLPACMPATTCHMYLQKPRLLVLSTVYAKAGICVTPMLCTLGALAAEPLVLFMHVLPQPTHRAHKTGLATA